MFCKQEFEIKQRWEENTYLVSEVWRHSYDMAQGI